MLTSSDRSSTHSKHSLVIQWERGRETYEIDWASHTNTNNTIQHLFEVMENIAMHKVRDVTMCE